MYNNLLKYLSVILFLAVAPAQAGKIGVAATVGDTEISELKLQNAIDGYLSQQGTDIGAIRNPERFKVIRDQVLDVLIGQELIWQAAKKDQTLASDEEVDRAFEQYQSEFKDEVSFEIKIKEGGYNRITLRDSLRQQLSAQKWLEKFVIKEVTVSDDEIHQFYLDNSQQFVQPEQVRARHILIKLQPQADDEKRDAAIKLLTEIRQNIGSVADFESLAREKSEDSSAARGGDLGYFQRGQMVKPFEQAAFDLAEPGDISEIVESRFGLHLIQLVDRKPASEIAEADVAEEIGSHLWRNKYQQAVDSTVGKLKEQAGIKKNGS